MKYNFVNREGKNYLVLNPDKFGQGTDFGYYRKVFQWATPSYRVVILNPLEEVELATELAAQGFLKHRTGIK